MTDSRFTLPLAAGTTLAHALVAAMAEHARVRALFIKGPVANQHGIRADKVSGDVDVLVDPRQVAEFTAVLIGAGWRERPASFAQREFITHSRSYTHPSWPCDIDVHVTFPGFLAEPEHAFEALWRRRVALRVADSSIQGADFSASVVIAALHALRSPESLHHQAELDQVVRVAGSLERTALEDVEAVAAELCATEPLRPFFERLGLRPVAPISSSAALAAWRLQSGQASRASNWIDAVAKAKGVDKLSVVVRALFPSRRDLIIEHPETAAKRAARMRIRFDRVVSAMRALPDAVHIYATSRGSVAATAAPTDSAGSGEQRIVPEAEHTPPPTELTESVEDHETTEPASVPGALPRRAQVARYELPDGALLLLGLRAPFATPPTHLNPIAVEIWNLLASAATLDELVQELSQMHQEDKSTIAPAVEKLIDGMRSHNLLSSEEQADASDTHSIVCVIPTHNRDTSMLRALTSVQHQTAAIDRIVVVDDLGSEQTKKAVASRTSEDPRVSYLDASAMPNKAAGASRNAGAFSKSSDLIAFLDDDDLWEPGFLASVVGELDRTGADLVISWGSFEREDVRHAHNWNARTGLSAQDVIAHNPGITGSNFVVRRKAFERIGGFDPLMWVYNDLDFFVRFLDSGARYSVVPEDLVVQVASAGTHLSSRSERRAVGIERYRSKYAPRLTSAQDRILRRNIHLARLYPEQRPLRKLAQLSSLAFVTTLPEWLAAVRRRVTKAPSYN